MKFNWSLDMIYLNNFFLSAEKIILHVQENQIALSSPKQEGSQAPSKLEQFQASLKGFFFKKDHSNEQVLQSLARDKRFDSYPKLKAILRVLLRLKEPHEIDAAIDRMAQITEKDWLFSPDKFSEYNARYGYFSDSHPEIQTLFEDLTKACRMQIS